MSVNYNKIAWATDIHLGHARGLQRVKFYESIKEYAKNGVEAVVITGDIADGSLMDDLVSIGTNVNMSVFFVLGNHDYYQNSIQKAHEIVKTVCARYNKLVCLSLSEGIVSLSDKTALIGVDGWGDARYGNTNTNVELNDFTLISDLRHLTTLSKTIRSTTPLHEKLRELADKDAKKLRKILTKALDYPYENLIILTHVPPFEGAAWHEGNPSGPDFLPYFSCMATGEVLKQEFEKRPNKNGIVLCGHTHSSGLYHALPNLVVKTAGAVYGSPVIDSVIDIEAVDCRTWRPE